MNEQADPSTTDGDGPAAGTPSDGGSSASPAPTRGTAKKAPAKRTAKKAPAKRTAGTAAKKAPAKRAPAKSAAKKTAKKAPAKRAPAKSAAKKPPMRTTARGLAGRAAAGKSSGPLQIGSTERRHPYRTLAERRERGLAWRDAAPLDGMDEFDPSPSRPSPVEILRAQDGNRLTDLVPIRYGRMSTSAFAFYRGSAAVMAYDLAQQPYTPGGTQLCGDAHLSNFGFFGSPERDLVFDVNDFDETLPGPFEWDLKRLAASVVLAGRDRGFKKKEIRAAVVGAVEGYRDAVQRLATSPNLDVWYFRVDSALIQGAITQIARAEFGKKAVKQAEGRLDQIFSKARGKTSLRAAQKLTEVVDGHRQFRSDPPLLFRVVPSPEEIGFVEQVFSQYKDTLNNDRRRLLERFDFQDLAHKVVGVGSVGTRAFVVLLEGRDPDDLLVLQVKQAAESVFEAHLRPSEYENHGQRVVEGQRYMQAASDIFLGWARGPHNDFYVRQLHDMKGSVDLTVIQPIGLNIYSKLCGATLARAHARGGDIVAIASYLGDDDRFAQAIARFGEAYADQAQQDYATLQAAIAAGDVPAETGY